MSCIPSVRRNLRDCSSKEESVSATDENETYRVEEVLPLLAVGCTTDAKVPGFSVAAALEISPGVTQSGSPYGGMVN